MGATICPTITVDNAEDYRMQMERIEPFAKRIHVDASDGEFAPRKLLSLDSIWWRGDRTIDLHLMYRYPNEHSEIILALNPRLVIIHAEAEGNFENFALHLHDHGIEVGIALLQRTPVATIMSAMDIIDHVLVFSGNLGHQGGSEADFDLLKKVAEIKRIKPTVEIGWDGGVTDANAQRLAEGGVDVLNVGGFIQSNDNPHDAYNRLLHAVRQ